MYTTYITNDDIINALTKDSNLSYDNANALSVHIRQCGAWPRENVWQNAANDMLGDIEHIALAKSRCLLQAWDIIRSEHSDDNKLLRKCLASLVALDIYVTERLSKYEYDLAKDCTLKNSETHGYYKLGQESVRRACEKMELLAFDYWDASIVYTIRKCIAKLLDILMEFHKACIMEDAEKTKNDLCALMKNCRATSATK